jgi:hypothetical protein
VKSHKKEIIVNGQQRNESNSRKNDFTSRTDRLAVALLIILVVSLSICDMRLAQARFLGGERKDFGKYEVLFLLSPSMPVVGDNSTKLNFSILDKDRNVDLSLIFAALTIKEKNSGEIVQQVPYKFYESGDISFPYTFKNNTDYEVVLQARICGDTNYKDTPLMASFDTSAVNPVPILTFNQMMIYYLSPILALSGGIIIVIIILKKRTRLKKVKKHS